MQLWEERERGWGTRPDGISLHLCLVAHKAYIKSYWDAMPDEVPDEYSRPHQEPRWIDVTEVTYKQVLDSPNNSHRIWQHDLYQLDVVR
jgi:hypothetical protein